MKIFIRWGKKGIRNRYIILKIKRSIDREKNGMVCGLIIWLKVVREMFFIKDNALLRSLFSWFPIRKPYMPFGGEDTLAKHKERLWNQI